MKMEIIDIYNLFSEIGSVVFATIDNDYPETRIAHFFAYDERGLYFRTMTTKPFYHQLVTNGKVSVCGMSSDTEVYHDEQGMPLFSPGYTIRVTGDCEEVDTSYIAKKAESNSDFMMGYKDIKKYPALRAFVIKRGRGEIFDFDFEKENREHKLLRKSFVFNDFVYPQRGLIINDNCVNCGLCFKKCSFDAISKGVNHYIIDKSKCDMCGDCTLVCKFNAIDVNIK